MMTDYNKGGCPPNMLPTGREGGKGREARDRIAFRVIMTSAGFAGMHCFVLLLFLPVAPEKWCGRNNLMDSDDQ